MSTTRSFVIEGMTCGHCELAVREEVEEVSGVIAARADRTTGRLSVLGDGVDDDVVRAAVETAGYRLAAVASPQVAVAR